MPKITSSYFHYKTSATAITFEIWFGHPKNRVRDQNKKFWVKIPDEAQPFLNTDYVFADTLAEVSQKFETEMRKYLDSSKKETKVIAYLYEFNVAVKKLSRDLKKFHSSEFENEGDVFGKQEISLAFSIGTITEINGKKFYSTGNNRMRDVTNYDLRDWKFIDYTPEREQWFRDAYSGMTKLINRIRDFFEAPQEKILAAIDKNSNLLNSSK